MNTHHQAARRLISYPVFRAVCILSACVSFMVCISSRVRAQEHVGRVSLAHGKWYLDGQPSRTIATASSLPAGGIVRIQEPSVDDFIVIVYADNKVVKVLCRMQGACQQPILLPRAVRRGIWDNLLGQGWDVIWSRLGRNHKKYVVHMSRTAGDLAPGELSEVVVINDAGRITLGAMFGKMPAGTYHARVNRLSPPAAGSQREATHAPFVVKWNTSADHTTRVSGLHPGLYELELLKDPNTENETILADAWFLVVPSERRSQADAFDEAVKLSAQWGTENVGGARSFLRAYLEYLSQSGNVEK